MMVISPWTRGGWVNSELFDHTSVLRFLEKRFGVAEPNISPWRRATCGDLTSIFDFDIPYKARLDTRWTAALPSVADYIEETEELCAHAPPPAIATSEGVPQQEQGTRPARSLPYRFSVEPVWGEGELTLRFVNDGPVGVIFGVQDEIAFPGWRYFTVAAQSRLEEAWPLREDAPHAIVVRGPNGFQRDFRGKAGAGRIEAMLIWDNSGRSAVLRLRNQSGSASEVSVHCAHTGKVLKRRVESATSASFPITVAGHRWYDLQVDGNSGTRLRLAGYIENGQPGVSEPAAAFPHPV